MERKKVFISGKITGEPNYREKFNQAEKEMTEQGHLVMNPAVFPEGFRWEDYMKITLAMLSVCDTIYLLNNWHESKGAQAEFRYAIEHGHDIMCQTYENFPITKQPLESTK